MAKQNVDYGYDIQKLYLEIMLADASTFVRCQTIFDHTLFDRKLQRAAEFIDNYVKENNILPTYDIVNASCQQQFKNPGELHSEHFDWLLGEFETFIRHKGLERAIIEASDLLEEGNYGPVEDMIKKAVQVGLTKDLGTNYFNDPRARLNQLKDNNGQVKTGWSSLDHILYGGFNRGELNVFAACSGGGKSLFLANLGVNWALAGLNVMYLTFELAENLVSMRIDSMTTGIASRDIFKEIDNVEMKVKIIGKKSGALQIKYMPSGKTANDIRSYLKEYEIKIGKKVDILLVDYLDLMMPISKKISAENLFIKDKYVSEELRNLAMEKQCVLVTASQINRSGVEESEFDHSHISGGISKIQTADNVFGIFTSRNMREQGRYQIQLMKTRNSSGVGQKLDLEFDVDTLRISDLDSDASEYRPKNTSVLESVSRKNNNSDEPVSKIKIETNSSEMKKFLNSYDGNSF